MAILAMSEHGQDALNLRWAGPEEPFNPDGIERRQRRAPPGPDAVRALRIP